MKQKKLRIVNTNSGYVYHADDDGTGNLRMYGASYNLTCQSFIMDEKDSGGFRLIDDATNYFVHADDDGKGNLRMYNAINDECQIFLLEQVGDAFRLQNKFSGYYFHADGDGTGNLHMFNEKNDACQLVGFYVLTTDPAG